MASYYSQEIIDKVIAFHGHSCPGLTIGIRASELVGRELGDLPDSQLVCITETDMCGVDAVQYLTGCTFGKGNLLFRDYGKHVYTVYSRTTRAGVRVLFHGKDIPADLRDNRDEFTRWILSASNDSILSVTTVTIPEPEPARIFDSVPCSNCGEGVMVSRTRPSAGKPICIPCHENQGGS